MMIRTFKTTLSNKKKLKWPVLGAAGAVAAVPGIVVIVKKLKKRKVAD